MNYKNIQNTKSDGEIMYVPQLVVGWQLAEKGVQLAEELPSDRNINYKLEMKKYDTESKLKTNWWAIELQLKDKINHPAYIRKKSCFMGSEFSRSCLRI